MIFSKTPRPEDTRKTGADPTRIFGIFEEGIAQLADTVPWFGKDHIRSAVLGAWSYYQGGTDGHQFGLLPVAAFYKHFFLNPLAPSLFAQDGEETVRLIRDFRTALSLTGEEGLDVRKTLDYAQILAAPLSLFDRDSAFLHLLGTYPRPLPPASAGFADLMTKKQGLLCARRSHWDRFHDPAHIGLLKVVDSAVGHGRSFFADAEEGMVNLPRQVFSPWPLGPALGPLNSPESFARAVEAGDLDPIDRMKEFFARMFLYSGVDATTVHTAWADLRYTLAVENALGLVDFVLRQKPDATDEEFDGIYDFRDWMESPAVMRPAFAELVFAQTRTLAAGDCRWRMDSETVETLTNTDWTPPEGGITFDVVDEGDFMLPFPAFFLEVPRGSLILGTDGCGDERCWIEGAHDIDVEGVFIVRTATPLGMGITLNDDTEWFGDIADLVNRLVEMSEEARAAGLDPQSAVGFDMDFAHGIQVTAVGRPRGLVQMGHDLYAMDERFYTVHLAGDVLTSDQNGGSWEEWPESSRKLGSFAANFLTALNQDHLDQTVTRPPRTRGTRGGRGGRRSKSAKEPYTLVTLGAAARQVSRSAPGRSLGKLLKRHVVRKHRAFFWVLDPGDRPYSATKIRNDGTTLYRIRKARARHERGHGRVTSRNYETSSKKSS